MHPVLFQLGPFVATSYGAAVALGSLLALALAQATAPRAGLNPRHAWNLLVLAVFAALATSRLLLIAFNLGDLRRHPSWLLAVAMAHHPLLTAAGVAGGATAAWIYLSWAKLPWREVGDCLASPLALALAWEQFGCLLAGSDYGSEASVRWAVTYTNPLAARWSGTPIGVPLHPVQAYAAVGSLMAAALSYAWLLSPWRRGGDVFGVWLMSTGFILFLTELFRDWDGRGVLFGGALDAPQLVALGMVLSGGGMLMDWPGS